MEKRASRPGSVDDIPGRFPATVTDQMEYMSRVMADQQLHCVIKMDGRIDEAVMARALRLSMDAEPVLGCRFVERPIRCSWERRDDLDWLQLCSIEEAIDVNDQILDFVIEPVDPRSDPLVSARVFRSETDTVCVKIDHVVSDAGGIKEYMYLLSSLYRRLADDPGFTPRPNVSADRTLGQVLGRFGTLQRLKSMHSGYYPKEVWKFPWRGGENSERAFAVQRIDRDLFGAIRECGKRNDATVNDVIMTAYYRALFELIDMDEGTSVPLQVPIDLRRYVPDGKADSICNLSGQLFPTITRKRDSDFTDTLRSVRDEMNRIKEKRPGLGSAVYLQLSLAPGFAITRWIFDRVIEHMVRSGKAHLFLSNLGVLSSEELGFGDASVSDAFLYSPVLFPPSLALGVSTFKETMTLTVGYCDPSRNESLMEQLMALVMSELESVE